MEDDILNYLSTVMFRGTPCINLPWDHVRSHKKIWAKSSKLFLRL